ncbi:MAG: PQQ-dependent sugar dehydrogenase [Alphaproteobacteria bacterium]|uniref:PQQ-dependent sugar dehydrogenase n=1 Tax=Candidatus Nitrobium versatile TaxID=2884831 RepID=A0A953LZ23_9BACT|nr:PQQ-dependent sugar dehydrogenase [Candidatus Nitrobium versatile]
MRKTVPLLLIIHLLVFACSQKVGGKSPQPEDVFLPEGDRVRVAVWVESLEIPWSLVFLPDGRALVSERPGRIRLIQEGKLRETSYAEIDAAHTGEAGLMGLAIHPDFPRKPYIYAMHTFRKDGGLYNKVVRLKDKGERGDIDRIVFDGIPGARLHDGGRIAFGPDGMLYITTGENFKADFAQDLSSPAGKILRITPEGEIPSDNPFRGSPVYSYGHRNPQGIAWHPRTGKLFASEHGPSGEFGRFGYDEINIIVKGGNYGWPRTAGGPGEKPYVDPILVWKKTTPPSGIAFYRGNLFPHMKGDLFVSTLRGRALIRIRLDRAAGRVERIERWFASDHETGTYGRLRDVVEGPDGALYFLTNNRDGRGNPRPGDDKIYRIVPK